MLFTGKQYRRQDQSAKRSFRGRGLNYVPKYIRYQVDEKRRGALVRCVWGKKSHTVGNASQEQREYLREIGIPIY